MKTIKNLLFVGLIALAAVITLAGCSDAPTVDPLEGTWKKGKFVDATASNENTAVELTIGDSSFKVVRVHPNPPNPYQGVVWTKGVFIGKYSKTAVTGTTAAAKSTYQYNNTENRWNDDTGRKGIFTVTGTGAAAVLTVSGTGGGSGSWDSPQDGLDGTYYKTHLYE